MADYLVPDWAHAALVLIDVQNDFVSGPAAIAGTAERVPAMAEVAAAFRAHGRPVVHVVRSYRAGESDVDLLRRSAVEDGDAVVRPGSSGARIVDDLVGSDVELDWESLRFGAVQQIGPAEYVVWKPRWSAFHRTPLDAFLGDHEVTTVVVAGCNLPNCPRATLFDASERDYRAVLVTDATSQTTPERVADMGAIGVQLRTADEVVRSIVGDELLGLAESMWVDVLDRMGADDLDRAGGCGDWTVRDLVNHVAGGAERYTILVDGGSAADTAVTRDKDYCGRSRWVERFWEHEHLLREACERADLTAEVDHRVGPRSGAALVEMRLMELVLHSQDLCAALGVPWSPPETLVNHLLSAAAPVIDELRVEGFFGEALTPASDSPADRLLAFAGRGGEPVTGAASRSLP